MTVSSRVSLKKKKKKKFSLYARFQHRIWLDEWDLGFDEWDGVRPRVLSQHLSVYLYIHIHLDAYI